VETEDAYASVLLREAGRLDPREYALATEIVQGVLRRKRWIDHLISEVSSRPIDRIDPDLLVILRMGFYQILHLEKVPDYAAVDESVRLARRRAGKNAAAAGSFVNGVLRGLLRARGSLPRPPDWRAAADPVEALALSESYPEWLVRRWAGRLGLDETASLLRASNRRTPVAVRVVPTRDPDDVVRSLALEGIDAERSRYLDDFLVVRGGGAAHRTRPFHEGAFYIQDEASAMVARMVGAKPGEMILDACAAPGGKALDLACRTAPGGLVVAADRRPGRLRVLEENAARMKVTGVAAVACDMAATDLPLAAGARFDAVLVDAPCSGTGVIRRHPEIRDRVDEERLEGLASLQASLLDSCSRLVGEGGRLVYAVCSLEPEEGLERIETFLERSTGFVPEDPAPFLPDAARGLVKLERVGPVLQTWPHRDELDGFFAIRLRRV